MAYFNSTLWKLSNELAKEINKIVAIEQMKFTGGKKPPRPIIYKINDINLKKPIKMG